MAEFMLILESVLNHAYKTDRKVSERASLFYSMSEQVRGERDLFMLRSQGNSCGLQSLKGLLPRAWRR